MLVTRIVRNKAAEKAKQAHNQQQQQQEQEISSAQGSVVSVSTFFILCTYCLKSIVSIMDFRVKYYCLNFLVRCGL